MLKVLYFEATVGLEREQFPQETVGTVKFYDVLNEVAKMLNFVVAGISVAPPGRSALVTTDYQLTVDEIIKKHGSHFCIINRGIVGATAKSRLFENPAEKCLLKFPDLVANINPKHPKWLDRVKLEVKNLDRYLKFLQQKHASLWFFLKPSQDPTYNFVKWDGQLKIPSRPDISFEMVLLLTSEYPKVFPKAFVENDVTDYCRGKVYPNHKWEERGKTFIKICHDHIDDQSAWDPHLSIAHFFIREVWYWWNAQINVIIEEWEKKHNHY